MDRRQFVAGSLAGLDAAWAQGQGRGAQEPNAEAFALIDTARELTWLIIE